MAQILIVEGNDGIAMASICKKRNLPPPLGYKDKFKFRDEFVKIGGGFDGAIRILRESLSQNDLTNIGIILDSDEYGAYSRRQKIHALLSDFYDTSSLTSIPANDFWIVKEPDMPVVGVWIMPDNISQGYLEHFLSTLIPSNNAIWSYTQKTVDDLLSQDFNIIPSVQKQKALLHTWLAWQKSPGKPFGQAVEANYFDLNTPLVDFFLGWFAQTFLLESK